MRTARAKVIEPQAAPAPAASSRGGNGGGRGGNGGGYDNGRQRQAVQIPNGLAVQVVYRSENAQGGKGKGKMRLNR